MAKYIVYRKKIMENISKLRNAFLEKELDFELFYSVKSNSSDLVLKTIKEAGASYEMVSSYEWNLVKKFNLKSLVLNGPAKSIQLVEDILKNVSVLYFNIDNDTDFDILRAAISQKPKNIRIGLRVYLKGGDIWNRFGYDISDNNLKEKIKLLNSFAALDGFHFHFSTNNFNLKNYENLLYEIKAFIIKNKIKLKFLNIGGGLPAANEFVFQSQMYEKLPDLIAKTFPNLKIISEAGRNIVSDAVDISAEIISLKKISRNHFDVNIDTNIMHFQCFFEKKFWAEYVPLHNNQKNPTEITIFGNSCMQIDKIADNVLINQRPSVGDKIVIHNIGAYSYSQAANFISKIPKVIIYEK